jgi:hypothetical protein
MKLIVYVVALLFIPLAIHADEVILVTGGSIKAEKVETVGEEVVCYHSDGTSTTIRKGLVKKIEYSKPKPKKTPTAKVETPTNQPVKDTAYEKRKAEWLKSIQESEKKDDIEKKEREIADAAEYERQLEYEEKKAYHEEKIRQYEADYENKRRVGYTRSGATIYLKDERYKEQADYHRKQLQRLEEEY